MIPKGFGSLSFFTSRAPRKNNLPQLKSGQPWSGNYNLSIAVLFASAAFCSEFERKITPLFF